jgi:ABC-type branched-subunit amino acid transport system ATPase component
LEIAERSFVPENGRVALEGEREKLLPEEQIRKAYLGL